MIELERDYRRFETTATSTTQQHLSERRVTMIALRTVAEGTHVDPQHTLRQQSVPLGPLGAQGRTAAFQQRQRDVLKPMYARGDAEELTIGQVQMRQLGRHATDPTKRRGHPMDRSHRRHNTPCTCKGTASPEGSESGAGAYEGRDEPVAVSHSLNSGEQNAPYTSEQDDYHCGRTSSRQHAYARRSHTNTAAYPSRSKRTHNPRRPRHVYRCRSNHRLTEGLSELEQTGRVYAYLRQREEREVERLEEERVKLEGVPSSGPTLTAESQTLAAGKAHLITKLKPGTQKQASTLTTFGQQPTTPTTVPLKLHYIKQPEQPRRAFLRKLVDLGATATYKHSQQ
ncbi:hypothetical protein FIBSPDRAFT_898931 [Athelia psychrophila]|uniref:Uncharacterized protein n=1 Tax=Athelia psychrophila TaxID=1759441 RepID=A0A166ACL9_9AGAM|nr:hypothetical protein FIBSPDRAFT_898931 [Fibularhizoctonia sp. CBS 109695]